jgi:outer membrane protein assembly factor BamD (BamD/ComL family)
MRATAFSRLTAASIAVLFLGTATTPAWAFLDFLKKKTNTRAPGSTELQAQEAAANALLAQAQGASSSKAEGIYEDVIKRYPLTNAAAEAAYGKALIVRQNGKLKDAFAAFQLLVDNYRQSTRFSDAIQQQFEIAEEAKGGKKQRSLIILPMKLGPNETIDLYKKVIVNAPFGRFAPLSQFAIAEIHQDQGEKNEAVAAYQSIVDNYPASKEAAEAQFRIGAISNIASKATADSSNLTASRDALQTYITTNPSGDRAMEAKTMLTQIDTDEALRSLEIGKFYEKTGKPKAAAIYYNEALKFGSPEVSEEARTRLSQVSGADPDAVVDAKMNNPGNDYTAPAAVDLRNRADYAGPPAPELARLSAKPKMRKDDDSFAPLPINEPKLPTVGDPAAAPAAGSLLPPVAGDKPALLPVPPPPPGIPPQPEPPKTEAPKAEEKKGN